MLSLIDTWSTAEKLGVPGEETRATVTSLQPAQRFHLRVTAQNSLGQGPPSQELLVTTTEEGIDNIRTSNDLSFQ